MRQVLLRWRTIAPTRNVTRTRERRLHSLKGFLMRSVYSDLDYSVVPGVGSFLLL
jgi:hypothetical protein